MCLTLHDAELVYFSDDIGSNIDNSHSATTQATSQLLKASKLQKSNSSLVMFNSFIFCSYFLVSIVLFCSIDSISRSLSKIKLQFKNLTEADIVSKFGFMVRNTNTIIW